VTTYTTPHSLPIIEPTDKIAATSDGLRQDINELSAATGLAITAEGARAEKVAKGHADDKDALRAEATLTSANRYTDAETAKDRGRLGVHATAWPVPNPTTPTLDW
jgi:hypothetical protein